MAKKRCISVDFYNSEWFCELTTTAKNLYTLLILHSDDDGVVINPKAVLRMSKTSIQTLRYLCDHNLLLCVDGVYIIRHWHLHNNIQPSRKIDSLYQEQLSKLCINRQKEYCLIDDKLSTKCRPNINKLNINKVIQSKSNQTEPNLTEVNQSEYNRSKASTHKDITVYCDDEEQNDYQKRLCDIDRMIDSIKKSSTEDFSDTAFGH